MNYLIKILLVSLLILSGGYPDTANTNKITDPIELAQFKAQIQHESGGKSKTESGYYRNASRILKIFGNKRLLGKDPKTLTKSSEKLFNTVYGGEWGRRNLGNTEAGDGFKYRGRGYIQITGKSNYKKFGDMIGVDLVANPEKALEPDIANKLALAFWNTNVKSKITDFTNTKAVTRIINGGSHGLAEREALFNKFK